MSVGSDNGVEGYYKRDSTIDAVSPHMSISYFSYAFSEVRMEEVFPKLRSQSTRRQARGSRKPRQSRLVLCGALALSLVLVGPANAGSFTGTYDLSNWTLIDTEADGFAMTPDAGLTLVLTGGNNGSGLPGVTDFVINAPTAGLIQFNWSYTSLDSTSPVCGPLGNLPCDDGGYLLGGAYTELADDTTWTTLGSGMVSFAVTSGESFGFQVDTADNEGEPGILTLSDFSAPVNTDASEPGTVSVVLGLGATVASARLRKREAVPWLGS